MVQIERLGTRIPRDGDVYVNRTAVVEDKWVESRSVQKRKLHTKKTKNWGVQEQRNACILLRSGGQTRHGGEAKEQTNDDTTN